VATKKSSAEILNMNEARARKRASDLTLEEFPSASDYLRTVREAQGLSLDDIAERTHIKSAFLEAIERRELERLPSRPFAIGFVKSYAEAVGADAARVVAKFKQDSGFSAAPEIKPEAIEAPRPSVETAERPLLSFVAVALVLGFMIWCALVITRPRDVSRPFSLDRTPIAVAPATAPSPSPEALRGVPGEPLPALVEAAVIDPVDPVYPRRCEAGAAETETVELAFNVSPEGKISGERVARSSNGCFNDSALNAARLWRFTPRTVDGIVKPAYDVRRVVTFKRP